MRSSMTGMTITKRVGAVSQFSARVKHGFLVLLSVLALHAIATPCVAGILYVTEGGGFIESYNTSSAPIGTVFGNVGNSAGGITIDANGNVYVTNQSANT